MAFKSSLAVVLCFVLVDQYLSAVVREEGNLRSKRQTQGIEDLAADIGPGKQVDFLLLMDRSKGMGQRWFYLNQKKLAQAILLQYAVIHPDYVRIAVITFGHNAYTVIDHISVDTNLEMNTKGQMFYDQPTNEWADVLYDDDDEAKSTTNLKLGFEQAQSILSNSLRPDADKVMLVLTDGNYKEDEDPLFIATDMKLTTKIYSGALGPWAAKSTGNIRELASNPYLFGQYVNWTQAIQTTKTAVPADAVALTIEVPESVCGGSCPVNSKCINNVYSGHSECTCLPGYYFDGGYCYPCAMGEFKPNVGNDQCLVCPSNFSTAGTSSADLSACTCTDPSICDATALDTLVCDTNPCNDHQYCVELGAGQFECRCIHGFEGDDCSINPDDCSTNPCDYYGSLACIDSVDSYLCICAFGWEGELCDVNTNECIEGLCLNNGTCTDHINGFTCNCLPEWQGTYCQVPAPTTTTTTTTPAPVRNETDFRYYEIEPIDCNVTCTEDSRCFHDIQTGGSVCLCMPGWYALDINGDCPVSRNAWTKVALDQCNITCPNNSACYQEESTLVLECRCDVGFVAMYDPTDTCPLELPATPTAVPVADENDMLVYIIAGAAGGFILIVIIISVCCAIAINRRRKKAEEDAAQARLELSTLQRNRGQRPYRRTLTKTISQAFSGFWKKGSMRGNGDNYTEKTTTLGSPSAPTSNRPDILGPEAEQDFMYMQTSTLTRNRLSTRNDVDSGMAGWRSYLGDLYGSGVMRLGVIADVDTPGRHAATDTFNFSPDEIDTAWEILLDRRQESIVKIQGIDFQLIENADDNLEGRSLGPSVYYNDTTDNQYAEINRGVDVEEKLYISKTRRYIVIFVSDIDVKPAKVKKEIAWITDHIKSEGY